MNGRKQFTTANQARFGVATPKGLHSQGSLLPRVATLRAMLFCWKISAEQHRPFILKQNSIANIYSRTASPMYIHVFQQKSIVLGVAIAGSGGPSPQAPCVTD